MRIRAFLESEDSAGTDCHNKKLIIEVITDNNVNLICLEQHNSLQTPNTSNQAGNNNQFRSSQKNTMLTEIHTGYNMYSTEHNPKYATESQCIHPSYVIQGT